MQKKSSLILGLFALLAVVLACANPVGGTGPTPLSPASVETIVAATFQALTAPAPVTVDLLPHSMYFLNNDSAGFAQVYRLEKNGKTVTQITFEPDKVDGYDVSLVDGSVVYVSNNKLYTVRSDGSNRSMIVDGGPVDENNSYLTNISSPVFSPNAETIAFGYKGLNFYSIVSGQYNTVLQNQLQTMNGGDSFPAELYWPEKYTADGSKLVITLGYMEGASAAIYYLNGNALVRLKNDVGALICCGNTEWTSDGSALYAGNASFGMFISGLWRVDSVSGAVTTLINGEPGDGTFNFASAPFPAPDGQLYYFFASQNSMPENSNHMPLQLVRSATDGVTGRTVLRPETYESMNEALWAPDASFVIVAQAPVPEVYQGGLAQLVYTDGQKGVISLLPFAMEMKWGP